MKCEEVRNLLIEYIDGNSAREIQSEIESHLKECAECRKEYSELQNLFRLMGEQKPDEPDESLRRNFKSMLASEIEKQRVVETVRDIPLHHLLNIKWSSPFLRIAAGIILLVGGISIGMLLKSGMDSGRSKQLTELKSEMKDMKEMLMMTMLTGESASQRIKAVNYSAEIPYPNQKVIAALVSTLNHDKNVNVRMAAAYSLEKFWDNAVVRDSLVASLDHQTEPILQIVLINILTEKKESKAVKPMKNIIDNKNTMKEVKEIAEKSIKVLS